MIISGYKLKNVDFFSVFVDLLLGELVLSKDSWSRLKHGKRGKM
jgi:hypothetical protein